MKKKGKVYLIGAGPGDPGLFTLKGKEVLEKAEVIIYDRLVSNKILSYADPEAEFIYVGKISGKHALAQEKINELLVKKAEGGKIVARLKGGDSFVFGRGGEEALFIKEHGCEFEIIPGITSAIAVPAYAGIPVTHRDFTSSLAFITGHEKPDKTETSIKWKEIANGIGTLVFLMGMENLAFICSNLMENGKDPKTPIALIRWGTLPQQQVITGTLENIVAKVNAEGFKPPAIIVVGEVVKLHSALNWLEKKPLWGKKIVVTRARAQASVLSEKIIAHGGEAIEFPSIKIEKEADLRLLHKCLKKIDKYDWLIFTSVNAVGIFLEEMKNMDMDIRDLKGIKICAIGPATCESLQNYGLKVDIVPDEYKAEGIIEKLDDLIKPGDLVLLPRAKGARKILPQTISSWGVQIDEIPLYEAKPAAPVNRDILAEIKTGNFDFITFTSSSTVSNFVNLIGEDNLGFLSKKAKIACIGPVTASKVRDYGLKVDVMANEYTIDGLIDAIIEEVKE